MDAGAVPPIALYPTVATGDGDQQVKIKLGPDITDAWDLAEAVAKQIPGMIQSLTL